MDGLGGTKDRMTAAEANKGHVVYRSSRRAIKVFLKFRIQKLSIIIFKTVLALSLLISIWPVAHSRRHVTNHCALGMMVMMIIASVTPSKKQTHVTDFVTMLHLFH